jgi:2',3'-cyclic-nucleotide 2'-phosphodiesterase / 3'-nucleotidase
MRMFRFCLYLSLLTFAAPAADLTLRLIATTDLHGNLYPYDYFTAKSADRGLARIATLIRKARAENPNNLLLDCGDTIQGSPLETVHQLAVRAAKTQAPDPMMAAMNALHYDAMAVGNHEFNYGLGNLNRAREVATFPWLSANTVLAPGSEEKPFAPYIVKEVGGVKVGIVGLTTPGVPSWEEPRNYKGYVFEPGLTAITRAVADLKSKHTPDVIVLIAHAGLGGDLGDLAGENMVRSIAERVPGIDAIVFGHTHAQEKGKTINGVLLMQPKNWGISLGIMDISLTQEGSHWIVKEKHSDLRQVTPEVEADPEIMAIAKPYHDAAETYLSSPVSESPADLSAQFARVEDSALIDAIQQVQLHFAKADVSFASSFNPSVRVKKGPVTVREIAALYVYDNILFAIEGNGRMVRSALENAARFYKTCPDTSCATGPLINSRVIGFNYDMAEGVEYEIDLTKPEGERITNLRYHGKPLSDEQPLRLAVNNYRAGGSAGYTMFKGAKVLWRSSNEIRDLMIEYYGDKHALPSAASRNWRVIPQAAQATLEAEAAAESRRGANK